jgi:hypothetical protein
MFPKLISLKIHTYFHLNYLFPRDSVTNTRKFNLAEFLIQPLVMIKVFYLR